MNTSNDKGKGSKDSYASRYGSAAPNQPPIPVISVTGPDEDKFADDFMALGSAAFGPERLVNSTSPFAGLPFLQDNSLLLNNPLLQPGAMERSPPVFGGFPPPPPPPHPVNSSAYLNSSGGRPRLALTANMRPILISGRGPIERSGPPASSSTTDQSSRQPGNAGPRASPSATGQPSSQPQSRNRLVVPDYCIPEEFQGMRLAMGNDSWRAVISLMVDFVEGKITKEDVNRQTARLFQAPENVKERFLTILYRVVYARLGK
ncbi:hypothetical protein EJ04DRAFT_57940 [Polyplosphaeria fusca]|uniref:Uncharacterized protein n=1 Tax=Polyplosphaeria fusca TaxID=682080 RepID=A0A9P4QM89_9PLEO|nr:hypothetical protein EJ04DRAFT_57940 [Polyplosphaeria fusca]